MTETKLIIDTVREVYDKMLVEKDRQIEALKRELSDYRKKEAKAASVRGYDEGEFDNL